MNICGKKIAIVGGGVSGLCSAHTLTKKYLNNINSNNKCEPLCLDIFEKNRNVGGLINTAVMPDRINIKSILDKYKKEINEYSKSSKIKLRFIPNYEIEQDISLKEILSLYDAVIFACGVDKFNPLIALNLLDKKFALSCEELCAVLNNVKSFQKNTSDCNFSNSVYDKFVYFSNVCTNNTLTVFGGGNSSLELLRILTNKKIDDLKYFSHLSSGLLRALYDIRKNPPRIINIIGRKNISEFKWELPILRDFLEEIDGSLELSNANIEQLKALNTRLSRYLLDKHYESLIEKRRIHIVVYDNASFLSYKENEKGYLESITINSHKNNKNIVLRSTSIIFGYGFCGSIPPWLRKLKDIYEGSNIIGFAGWSDKLRGGVYESIISAKLCADNIFNILLQQNKMNFWRRLFYNSRTEL